MEKGERKKIITGNWKMYKTIEEGEAFVKQLIPLVQNSLMQVFLAVPYTLIGPLARAAQNSTIVIGAQNMNDASEGAFTGEIAGKMLKDAGAQFVLLGHSERRRLFHEDNAFINRKLKKAVEVGIRPVLCIGESQTEHEANQTHEVLERQLTEGLAEIDPKKLDSLIIAYEPVWAIGTGQTATPELVQETHQFCREVLSKLLGEEEGQNIVIQYGGSVNPVNAHELLEQPDIDGLLVGGASLSLESFSKIVNDGSHQIIE